MTDLTNIRAHAAAIVAEIDGTAAPTPVPDPVPAPTPDPTPVPATPLPPAPPPTVEEVVDGLLTGATPCGAPDPAGMKVVGRDTLPAGISFDATTVTFHSFSGDFYDPEGWDFGGRRTVFLSRIGAFGNVHYQGGAGSNPFIHCQPGGGFDLMEYLSVIDCGASMILKQENGGFAKAIRRSKFVGMSQDALKTSGDNQIEENLFGPAIYRGGAPHSDTLTCMAAFGPTAFRRNAVDWSYVGQIDQAGINNWFRIESYKAGNLFDDIEIDDNLLIHANPTSFAMQITTKNSPVWAGSVKVRNNRMKKAGGNNKILYAASPNISEWSGQIDLATGLDIPLGAA